MNTKKQLKNKFKFSYFKYPENNLLLSEEILDSLVDLYFNNILKNIGKDTVVMVQLIMQNGGIYRSLSKFVNVDLESNKDLKNLFKLNLGNKIEFKLEDLFKEINHLLICSFLCFKTKLPFNSR